MDKVKLIKLLLIGIFLFPFADNVNAKEKKEQVIVIGTVKGGYSGNARSPMRLPIIYIEGHTLMFEDALIGQCVTILQDGQEVYSDVVGTDCKINLPESLNGEYELQMVIGDHIITGTFCVE